MTTTSKTLGRRQLSLSEDLCASTEQKLGARFENLEAFLEYVLRELMRDEAGTLDKSEQAVLERRLRDLGYL